MNAHLVTSQPSPIFDLYSATGTFEDLEAKKSTKDEVASFIGQTEFVNELFLSMETIR